MDINQFKHKIVSGIANLLPKEYAHQLWYFVGHKKFANFKNPVLFDEKLHWLMIHRYDGSYSKYADKYAVREYMKQLGLEHLLIPLLGVYQDVSEIDLDVLPNEFILKTNHGSGTDYYAIVHDKNDANQVHQALTTIANALTLDYSKHGCEYHYHEIKPCILVEPLLHDSKDPMARMSDYKFECFGGQPKYCLVMKKRDQGEAYYDLNFQYQSFVKKEYEKEIEDIEKPQNFDQMVEYARILSKEFCYARIDFYNVDGKIYFGEITLTENGGNAYDLSEQAQRLFGSMIDLSKSTN